MDKPKTFGEELVERTTDMYERGPDQIRAIASRLHRERVAGLLKALRGVIGDLEHVEADSWMSGSVHSSDYRTAIAALAAYDEEQG